jgi:hypothetical protein
VYPEYPWLPWQFTNPPRNIWNDEKNVKKFIEWAKPQLAIKETNDWHRVTTKDIINLGGTSLIKEFKTLPRLLSFAYPELTNIKPKTAHYNKTQAVLKNVLKKMFPKQGLRIFQERC